MHESDPAARRPVGGMAIIEGVMMRGPERWAAAVRRRDGSIDTIEGAVPSWAARWERIPLARGIATLAESLAVGARVLVWSAQLSDLDRFGARAPRGGQAPASDSAALRKRPVWPIVAPALLIATALFFVTPAAIAHLAVGADGSVAFTAVESLVRVAVVVGYIAAIRLLPDVRRLFAYHGAEHKAVAAFESGDRLTVDAARAASTRHVRCGTTFLLVVVVVASVAHVLIGAPALPILLGSRALVVPLAAAVAYEAFRVAAEHPERAAARALLGPGLALQALTTDEPSDEQLEVALVALEAALRPELVPAVSPAVVVPAVAS